MRKKLGIASVVAGLALLGCSGGLVGGWAFLQSVIDNQVREAINQDMAATVDFEDLNVSLLSTFPSAGVRLTKLSVTGKDTFDGVSLAQVDEVLVHVALSSLLFGDAPRVEGVTLTSPRLHVVVKPDGAANYDLWPTNEPAAPAAEASAWQLQLDSLHITGGELVYDDQQGGTGLIASELSVNLGGAVTSDALDLHTQVGIGSLTMSAGGLDLLSGVKLRFDGGTRYELATGAIALKDTTLSLNELGLVLDGGLTPVDAGWDIDLSTKTLDTSFKTLLSILPAAYTASFADVDASGTLKLDGTIKGLYAYEGDHLPAFDLALVVADARVKYPDLPASVEGIAADIRIAHPEGATDLATLDVSHLRLRVGDAPIEGRLSVHNPVTDPGVTLQLLGKLDLAALQAAWPMEGVTVSGAMDVDLDVAGRMSAFEAQAADKVRATGHFNARGVRYTSTDLPVDVQLDALKLGLSPQRADITELVTRFGNSDVAGTGQLDNLMPYMMGRGALVGHFDLHGKRIDLEPFAGEDAAATEPSAAPPAEDVLVAVPTDLDLAVDVRFARADAMGMVFDNVNGRISVKDGAMRMDDLRLGLLDGQLQMSGAYVAPTAALADLDLTLNAARFDVARTLEAFPSLQRLIPVAKGATGHVNSGFTLNARLGPDGSPELSLLASKGALQTYDVALTPAALARVAEQLMDPKFKRIELNKQNLLYELVDGQLKLQPADVLLGGVPAKLSGGAGVLDQTMDLALDLRLPTASLKGAPFLAGAAALGEQVDVRVKLTGGWDNPKVGVTLGQAVAAAVKEQVTARVSEQVGAVSADAIAAAKANGDKLVAEAERQAARLNLEAKQGADRLRAEAKTAGDKLISDAQGKPLAQAAARESAKKLKEQADKRANALVVEADKKGKALVSGAQQKRDALVREAEAGAAKVK